MPRRYEVDPQGPFYLGDIDLASLTLFAQTAAETSTGTTANTAYLPFFYDVRRAGVVPNSASAASANTAALQTLFDPTKTGPTGVFIFPNTTGADIYYFNDWIPCRDGVRINLCGSTLSFSKTILSAYDSFAGFLMGIRDFSVENGTITFNYTGGGGSISVVQIGARGSECGLGAYFPNTYDSLLARPQGNCYLRNLRITSSNNTNGLLIQMTGGLQNVRLEDIDCDAGGIGDGIDYEFGWATSGTTNLRQTSHAKNLEFKNVLVKNINTTSGTGLTVAGAYNFSVDGLYVSSASAAFVATTGESLFYRPWAANDVIGCKRTKTIRNVVGQGITGTGITLTGAQLASGGYLAALGLTAPSEVSLSDYVLENFAIDGTINGYGILCSAGQVAMRMGRITGFLEGIRATDELVNFEFSHLRITDCWQKGVNLNGGSAISSPVRQKVGSIKNCLIGGNSKSSAGAYPGVELGNTASVVIESNRLNYELAYDGVDETTQGDGVLLASTANGVVCQANRVGFVLGGSFAYHNVNTSPPSGGNTVRNPLGTVTTSGIWDEVPASATLTLTAATPGNLAVSYGARTLRYMKTGNRIDYSFQVSTSAFTYTTATGRLLITGLPYAAAATALVPVGAMEWSGITKAGYTNVVANVDASSSLMGLVASGSGVAIVDLNITDLPSGGTVNFRGTGHYFV